MAQGHLQLIDRELRALLAEGNTEDIVKWVKERVSNSHFEEERASYRPLGQIFLGTPGSSPAPEATLERGAPRELGELGNGYDPRLRLCASQRAKMRIAEGQEEAVDAGWEAR